jgi:hypothetical protein
MRRGRGDEGVSVLEAAMTAPVVFLLVLGVFEFGLVYRDYLSVGDAIGDAVQVGSVQGNKMVVPKDAPPGASVVTADYSIVKAVREGTSGIPPEWIEKIVIYHVDFYERTLPAMDLVPDSCRNGSSSNAGAKCNVYPAFAAFYAVQNDEIDYFDCANGGVRACGWDPITRNDGPVREDIDYLGVYVKLDRELVTGMFGDTFTLEQAQVLRLEPGQVEE